MKRFINLLVLITTIGICSSMNLTNAQASGAGEDESQIQMKLIYNDRSVTELEPLDANSKILVGNIDLFNISVQTKITIEGTLPDADSRVSEVFGSLDLFNSEGTVFNESDKTIENQIVDGKNNFKITYENLMSNMDIYFNTNIKGALYFEIKTESLNGSTDNYIAILDNKALPVDTSKDSLFLTEYVGVKNNDSDEILSGTTEMTKLGKGDSKFHYAELSKEIRDISMVVNRQQSKIETVKFSEASGKSLYWMSIGNNYISVNGGLVQRFVVNSNIYKNQNSTPPLHLKKGLNVINLSFIVGKPPIAYDFSTMPPGMKDKDISIPWLNSSNNMEQRYVLNIPYIIYWDGEESEIEPSNDADIAELKANSFPEDYKVPTQYEIGININSGGFKVSIPKTIKNNKLLLGILPSAPGANVNVLGNEQSEGGYFEDGKDQCGNYYGINLDDPAIETDDNDNKIVKIEVTAPDGITKKIHRIEIMRKSSECSLESLTFQGGSVRDLDQQLSQGEQSFILDLDSDNSPITLDNIQVSSDATYTVDGQRVEGDKITVSAGDITRLEVLAEDEITSKIYLFLHKMEDGTLPYFSVSQETKDLANDMLSGWHARPKSQKKDLRGSWPIFSACATATDENNNLDGNVINDVRKNTYNQPTDYGRDILQLVMTGENPYEYTDDKGNNLVEHLEQDWTGPFANKIWALMGLRAAGANIPDGLVKDVTALAGNEFFDLDMRAWALGAVSDLIPKTQLAALVEKFRPTLITEGDEAGMFYNFWYKYANTISHGCVLEGMAAAGIDIEKVFAVNDSITPLKALQGYQLEDGSFWYDISKKEPMWAKDAIIGLGDIVHGDNVWNRYALTVDKYQDLLNVASVLYGDDGQGIDDEKKREALKETLEQAADALPDSTDIVEGLGKYYYALYEAVANINPELVKKPQVRVCTLEESDQVDTVIVSIESLHDLAAVSEEKIAEVREAFGALGGGDVELKAKLQGYVTNQKLLIQAEKYQNFADKVAAVGTVDVNSGAAIQSAQDAYEELDDSLKQEQPVKERYKILQENHTVYQVITAIANLPSADVLTLADADAVSAARASYDALDTDLKAQISNSSDLITAEKKIRNLKAVKTVSELIEALPDSKDLSYETDGDAVKKAYQEYMLLTEEQRELLDSDQRDKLLDDYETIKGQQSDAEAVQEVIENIADIPALEELTLEDDAFVKSVRGLYESLSTEALKARVTNYTVLTGAEAKLTALKQEDLLELIEKLPDPETLEGHKEDGSDMKITERVLQEIAAAVSRYQSMDEALQKVFANENPAEYRKLMDLKQIAEQYNGYIEEVLTPLVEEIASFELPVTKYNMGIAGDLLTRYQANEEAKTYLNSIAWEDGTRLQDKMETVESQLSTLNSDLEAAAKVDNRIEDLPDEVNQGNVKDVKAALEQIQKQYNALSEQAKTFIIYLDRWEDIKTGLDDFLEAQKITEAVMSQIEDAVDEDNDLLSEDTIVALKKAEAAYDALTPSQKTLISADLVKAMDTMKEKISAAKKEENVKNKLVTYNGTIPWDVVLKIERIAQSEDSYAVLRDELDEEKKASILNAFNVTAYQILEDGSYQDFMPEGGMSLTVHTDEDLSGKTPVIVHLEEDGTVEFLQADAKDGDITFTTQSLSSFASGVIRENTGSGDDGDGNNNNGSNTNNSNNGTQKKNSGGNSSTPPGNTTGGNAGVPKTGDVLADRAESMMLLLFMSTGVFMLCLKKKKNQSI